MFLSKYPVSSQKGKRDEQIDVLKFLLICTVIWGHVIMTLGNDRIEMATFNYIYSFHMPLFVFISGYFTHPGNFGEKGMVSAFRFLSLFIIFNLLMWMVNWRELGIRTLLTPQYAMWYLLGMFYWRLCAMFIKQEWLTIRNLFLAILFSALVGFVPLVGEMFSFNRTVCFFCFFMAGMMCRGTDFFQRVYRIPWWSLLLPAIVIFAFIYWLYGDVLQYVYSHSYNMDPLRFFERVGQMSFAVILGLGFIQLSQIRMLSLFARFGQKSLFFYLYHTFFIMVLPDIVYYLRLSCSLPMTIVYTVVIIVVLIFLDRLRFLNSFLKFNLFEGIIIKLYHNK